jgi:hypothetical protein
LTRQEVALEDHPDGSSTLTTTFHIADPNGKTRTLTHQHTSGIPVTPERMPLPERAPETAPAALKGETLINY